MGRICSMHAWGDECVQSLVEKPDEKRLLRILGHKWEDNIEMDQREIVWEDVDWFHLARDGYQWQAVVIMVMNLQVDVLLGKKKGALRICGYSVTW
jgi:hypothetical protein